MNDDSNTTNDDARMEIIRKGSNALKKKDDDVDFVFKELDQLPYDPQNPENYVKEHLTVAMNNAFSTINLHTKRLKPVYEALLNEKDSLFRIFLSTFWITHFKMHKPDETEIIEKYMTDLSSAWVTLLYPMYCNFKNMNADKIPGLIAFVMPYFATQVLQETFILLSEGNPITAKKDFRMRLCKLQLELFTSCPILDSLMQERLTSLFSKPPSVDIPDRILNPPPAKKAVSVLIPKEDIDELVEIEHRIRPLNKKFKIASLSSLVSKAIKQDSMPYLFNVSVGIQVPKNGAADWTTNLPSLLPDPKTTRNINAKVEDYDPNIETRSLIHRSRRSDILSNYQQTRDEYVLKSMVHDEKIFRFRKDLELNIAKTCVCEPETIEAFVSDLQRLHRLGKKDQSPCFVEDGARLARLAKIKIKNDSTIPSVLLPRERLRRPTSFQRKYVSSMFANTHNKEPIRLSRENEMIDKVLMDIRLKHEDLSLGLI